LAPDFLRRVRFRIKRFVVRWPAIEPNHDAIDVVRTDFACSGSALRAQFQKIRKAQPYRGSQAELDKIPSRHSGAVTFQLVHTDGAPTRAMFLDVRRAE